MLLLDGMFYHFNSFTPNNILEFLLKSVGWLNLRKLGPLDKDPLVPLSGSKVFANDLVINCLLFTYLSYDFYSRKEKYPKG